MKFRELGFADYFKLVRSVLAPLAVAALLRLGLMIAAFALTGTQIMTQGDTSSYLEPGRNLIVHGVFASAGRPEIDRTPGYPIFAMLTGMVCGSALLTASAQILVSLVSLLLVKRIADRVFPNRNAGTIAAWLYAVEPLSIIYAVRLMPETLFLLLLLIAIERVLAFQRTGKLAALACAGVFLAAATYVRPVSYYLGFALAIGVAVTAPRRSGLWWKAPAVLLAALLPWLAAWQARNYVETGYRGFSSIVEQNLYFFQSAEVTAELQHISLGAEQLKLGYPDEAAYLAIHPEQRGWPYSKRLNFMRAQSVQILRAHPGLYLRTHFAGVGVVAFTPCATELLQLLDAYPAADTMPRRILNEGVAASLMSVISLHPGVTFVMAVLEVFLLLLYFFAFVGCWSEGREKTMTSTLVCIALYFLLISGGAQAVGRYRLPVMPELCVLAAGSLASRRNQSAGVAGQVHEPVA